MQSFLFNQNQNALSQSHVSEYSNCEFYIKTEQFQTNIKNQSQAYHDNDIHDAKNRNQKIKKLNIQDLQTQRQKKQTIFASGKQNNIPNQAQQPTTYSRKITIHKNYSLSPYNNFSNGLQVDESFSTNKIVQLQQELIQFRKQMSLKQSSWLKEKSILLNKIEICNYDIAQMKQRNNNLIQINQTLTHALGQSTKSSNMFQNDLRNDQIKLQLAQKNKRIKQLQQKLSRMDKQKYDINFKLNEEIQKKEYLLKNLEQYKIIVKQSNQRKLESDEKILLFIKNIQIIKKKLKSLPIKDQYLKPITSFLDSMRDFQNTYKQETSHFSQQSDLSNQQLISRVQKQKYSQNSDYLRYQNRKQDNRPMTKRQSRIYDYNNDANQQNHEQKDYSYGQWSDQSQQNNRNYNSNHYQNKNNRFFNQAKRIDTQQNQYQNYQNEYQSNNQDSDQVYLCDICQRVYNNQQFLDHINQCKEYETLLKQKKQIESRLISIKQQQYQSRKSNVSGLNSSAIILNKSRSKGKFIKGSNTKISINPKRNQIVPTQFREQKNHGKYQDNISKQAKSSNKQRNSNRKGNRTQRYLKNQQNSRLQLSQLLNISNISNRPNNYSQMKEQNYIKKDYYNQNNYFSSGNQNPNTSNYQLKKNPQIKYQTNIINQSSMNNQSNMAYQSNVAYQSNSNHQSNNTHHSNIGKQSMQQQIRKIVQALNQGGTKTNRSQISMKKLNNNKLSPINPSLKNYNDKQNHIQKDYSSRNSNKNKNGKFKC